MPHAIKWVCNYDLFLLNWFYRQHLEKKRKSIIRIKTMETKVSSIIFCWNACDSIILDFGYSFSFSSEAAEAKFKEVMMSYEAIKLERKNGNPWYDPHWKICDRNHARSSRKMEQKISSRINSFLKFCRIGVYTLCQLIVVYSIYRIVPWITPFFLFIILVFGRRNWLLASHRNRHVCTQVPRLRLSSIEDSGIKVWSHGLTINHSVNLLCSLVVIWVLSVDTDIA